MNDRFKFRGIVKLATQSIVVYSSFLENYDDELVLELSEDGLYKQIRNAGYNLTKEDWGVLNDYSDKDDYYPHYYLHCETIEQCTGLKDKNGKLIYEGDYLKKTFRNKPFSNNYKEKEKLVKVAWNDKKGAFTWRLVNDNDLDDYTYYSEMIAFENDEIVENP